MLCRHQGKWLGELAIALESLGWDRGDNVAVEIAGTSVYEIDGAGTKWAPVKGIVSITKMRSSLSRTLIVILLYHHNQTQQQ